MKKAEDRDMKWIRGLSWEQQIAFWLLLVPMAIFLYGLQIMADISWAIDKRVQRLNNKFNGIYQ